MRQCGVIGRRLAFFLSLATTSACFVSGGLEPYSPRPDFFDGTEIPLNTYASFMVSYFDGGPGGPKYIEELSMRCADPSMCATEVGTVRRPAFTAAEGRIAGRRLGSAVVLIDFVDPTSKRPVQQRRSVRFVEPVRAAKLEVGAKDPGNVGDLIVVARNNGDEHSCIVASTIELRSEGVDVSPQTLASAPADPRAPFDAERRSIYRCQRAREIAPGGKHFCAAMRCDIDPELEGLYACVSRAGGRVGAAVQGFVLYGKQNGRFTPVETRGRPDPRVCLTEDAAAAPAAPD